MAVDTQRRPRAAESPRLMRPVLRGWEVAGSSRRLLPAGAALVVAVLALGIASLLNAESLRRTAQIQPEGWQRSVGLALTKPLVTVSRGLGLDEPRRGLRRALGRSDEGSDAAVVFAAKPPPPITLGNRRTKTGRVTRRASPPPPKPAFDPSRPLRIWVAGDSLAITPGWQLVHIASRTHVIKSVAPVDGQVATGLERPDVFDWFGHIRSTVAKLHPKAVVLTFGANDDHNLMTGLPKGVDIGPFGGPSWTREYRRRVGGVMDDVTSRGAYVVWIGLPISRSAGESRNFRVLNEIYRSEAAKRPERVAFIDTYALFQDGNGRYADYLPNGRGELVKVRLGDGVHFEAAGGELIAWQVMKHFRDWFDLTSWKRGKTRGASTPAGAARG